MEPIPACEGEKRCRTEHYGRTRSQYSALVGRHRALQSYVRLVRGQK